MNQVARPQLPHAITRAYEADTQEKLGGWMELAGIDAAEHFSGGSVKDHPWVGLDVEFPFPAVGRGRVERCLIHPRGELMFDVAFPEPVPPIRRGASGYEVVDLNVEGWRQSLHRYRAHELVAMLGMAEEQPSHRSQE